VKASHLRRFMTIGRSRIAFFGLGIVLLASLAAAQDKSAIGTFEGHGDIGMARPGSATYDAASGTYRLRGSGENIWGMHDAFHFAWKKVSGDAQLSAIIAFPKSAGNPHAKAVLMLRQSLDADSIYADVALHANGLGALQYRDEKGGTTREIQSSELKPRSNWQARVMLPADHVRITRRGDYVYMSVAAPAPMQYDGESIRVPLEGEFYVGIGVCAHDENAIEEAGFSDVELKSLPPSPAPPTLYSTLETVAISSTDRQVVYLAQGRFEAPNWSRDGSYFLFNRNGHLEKLPVAGGTPTVIDTGFATRCNNDHGISPDSQWVAISDQSQETKSANGSFVHDSLVYVLPIGGGTPRRVTQKSPSYWHGWSPDGKTLAFVGQRDGEFDIYTIPVGGGDETRLTTAKGLDDGPEYSPDGKYIYFNSERTGHMQIWRMRADGGQQEQITHDEWNNWFPHISPDGKWMVFLTYEPGVAGHPENKDVMLRLMSLSDQKITVLAKLFGGQGTINVPSWSPDSKQVAFVSYQRIQ
jgi:TolB protein